jgi:poly(A) polymerase
MVENHLRPIMLLSPKASDAARMRWFRKMGDGAVPALIIAMADVMSSQGPDSGEEYRREFVQRAGGAIIDYLQRIRNRILSAPLITGADLIAAGMEPGPVLGMVLRRVRAAQDTGTINSFDDAMNMVKKLASEMDFSLKN